MSGKNDMISMAEGQLARKLTSRDASEGSSSNDQHIVGTSEQVSIIIHERTTSCLNSGLQEKLKSLEDAMDEEKQDTKPRIQKVPIMLRDNKEFKKYYEPRVVAIGPIHHQNTKLEHAKKLKRRLAGHFIKENSLSKENMCIKIKNEIENLRECYDEDVTKCYNDDDLTWMFLVDGCAMLHFIHCVVDGERYKKLRELKIKNHHVAFAQRDMFLLENQLPYKLLELLICSVIDDTEKTKLRGSFEQFINRNMMMSVVKEDKQAATFKGHATEPAQKSEQKESCHLLELLRDCLIVEPKRNSRRFAEKLLHSLKCSKKSKPSNPNFESQSFRSVNELKVAGIGLKRSDTSSLKDISFHPSWGVGTLRLPPIIVDDSAAPKFLNLIAYEMCPDFMNEFEVTSYICFLDSLIDHPDDVKELRKAHILHNLLGSDEEVAKLFNKIGTDLVANPNMYDIVKTEIGKHYDSKVTTWVAQFLHDHFSSPWTVLALIGALIALGLSSIQTFDSIHKKFFQEGS